MDWGAVEAIATVVAVGVSMWALVKANQSDNRADELQGRLVNAQETAARAEKSSAEALQRAAVALEQSATADSASAAALAAVREELSKMHAPKVVRWDLAHHAGSQFVLKNVGSLAALDVQLHPGNRKIVGDLRSEILGPDDHLLFIASNAAGAAREVAVTWRDSANGPTRTKALPFPRRD